MKKRITRLAIVLAALCPTGRAAPAQECTVEGGDLCELDFTARSSPGYTNVKGFVGLTGAGYAEMGLLSPEPIPLWVTAKDWDRIHVNCGGECQRVTVPGAWTANWTQTGSPGDFVTSTAALVTQIGDAWSAMFLPPRDFPVGQTKVTTVTATLVGTCSCPGYDDPVWEVKFEVETTRTGDEAYDVVVTELPHGIGVSTATPCTGTEPDCDLYLANDYGDAPWVDIVEYPMTGMILGEIRPLRSVAEDLDRYQAECGTTPEATPVESNFGEQKYCDELSYTWTVVAGPGLGTFVMQGRSTIFQASAPGPVTLRCEVRGTDGENASGEVTFTIHEPRVFKLDYGSTHPIARDDGAGDYDATLPEWHDLNGDGDAADLGERRVSAAYTRGASVVVDQVWFECGTKPPPYAVIRGTGPLSEVFRTSICTTGAIGPDELSGCDITASAALPNVVRKYDPYEIDWSISFVDDTFVEAGSTETWLYALQADPEGSRPRYETLYDIGCIAADGKTGPDGAFDAIWSHFKGMTVNRKARDGFNAPDGVQMGYWLEPATTCAFLPAMLADDVAPEGDGRCGAWAQLLHGCAEMQGIDDLEFYVVTYPQAAPAGGLLIKRWLAQPAICMGADGIAQSVLDGADAGVVPLGGGWANAPAIGPDIDGVLVTQPVPDDTQTEQWIHTGSDGICNTVADPSDEQVVQEGEGLPHNTHPSLPHPYAILSGADGVITSVSGGDDHVVAPTTNLFLGSPTVPGQLIDLPGIAAQNNADPRSTFVNHAVIDRGGWIYDPSYGKGPFARTAAACPGHENASLAALSVNGALASMQDETVSELDYAPAQ